MKKKFTRNKNRNKNKDVTRITKATMTAYKLCLKEARINNVTRKAIPNISGVYEKKRISIRMIGHMIKLMYDIYYVTHTYNTDESQYNQGN